MPGEVGTPGTGVGGCWVKLSGHRSSRLASCGAPWGRDLVSLAIELDQGLAAENYWFAPPSTNPPPPVASVSKSIKNTHLGSSNLVLQ